MSISYIKGTDSKEEYLKKKLSKSDSEATVVLNRQFINKFEIYCKYVLKKNSEDVIEDLTNDWIETKDVSNLVNLIANIHEASKENHSEWTWNGKASQKYSWGKVKPHGQKLLVSGIRLYLRARTGIKISSEDVSEKIVIPVDQEDREEYPLTLDQFQKIYDKCTVLRRKAKYLFMRDTGCRTHESVQITKSMIDFEYDNSGIAKVKLPKKVVKGKTKTRVNFLTPETAKMVQEMSKDLDDNTPIFVSVKLREKSIINRRETEMTAFYRNRQSLIDDGFSEFAQKHESGVSKIVMHSIRAFTATAITKGNSNNESLGHGYIGHKKYLEQYIRRSEAEQLEIFKNAIPFLTGITREYGESELALKVKDVESQLKLLHRENIELKKNGQKAVKAKSGQSSIHAHVINTMFQTGELTIERYEEIVSQAPKESMQKA